jgi:3-hydroxyisobutyrate dehydrogenase-like beta-hydroxyacid dehydrogenase
MEARMADKVGFIGLGNIGNPMSRRVLGAGFSLVVYDANPAAIDRLVKEGAEAASSPKDVASRAQQICLSLPTSPIVETVCLGKNGLIEGAAAGTIVIDLTSGNPPHTAQTAARLAEKGIHMIDAGVSGGVAGAEVGTLGIMVGGDEKIYEQCLPILRAIGQNIFHMGQIGAGHMTKALNNFLSAANYLAASEAVTVATKCGLDPAKVVAAINASSGMSFATMKRIPNFVLKGDFSFRGGMSTELLIKDLTTALSLGKEAGVPMFMAGLAQQLYQLAQSIQGPLAPNQSAIKLYEKWAGVENRAQ